MTTANSSATGKSLVKPLVGNVIPASEVRKSKKYDFSEVVDAMRSLKEGLALPCTMPDNKAAIYLQTFIFSLNRDMDGWKYSAQRIKNVVYCSRQATRTTSEGRVQRACLCKDCEGWHCSADCPVCAEDARRLRELERQAGCDEPEVSDELGE